MRAYKANMIPGGVTPTINVSQYDNDYAVTVTLIEGAEIYTPPAGATIRVEGTKPDGHGFEYACTYQGNVVTMPIYTQMTAVAGRFPIELVVYQNGLRVGSCNIIFAVEKAPLGEDTDISETVLPDIIDAAQSSAEAAQEAAEEAQEAAAQVLSSQIVTDASGSIASFSDGADDVAVKSLVASITPVQNLNGQANPYPAGGGVNKLRLSDTTLTGTVSGITYTYDPATEKITLSGTNTNTTSHNLRFFGSESGFSVPAFSSGETYTLSVMLPTTMYCQFTYRDADNVQRALGYIVGTGSWARVTFTIPDNYVTFAAFQLYVSGTATTINTTVYFELSEGSTAPTAWSPYTNICPISGRTGLTLTHSGKNLLNPSVLQDAQPDIYEVSSDGTITVKRNNTSGWESIAEIDLPAGQYTISRDNNHGVTNVRDITSETFLASLANESSVNSATFTVQEGHTVKIRLASSASSYPINVHIQIERGTSATAYEPYAGQTYPITWETEAGTVYGGTLDVVSGVLTVTHGYILLDGTQNISQNGRTAVTQRAIVSIDGKASGTDNIQSDRFAIMSSTDAVGKMSGRPANTGVEFYLPLEGTENTAASCKQWFANNNTQLVYELATPQTYQLTGAEVRTLLGINNIYTDAGNVSVEYIADTKLYIDNKIAELQALVLEN